MAKIKLEELNYKRIKDENGLYWIVYEKDNPELYHKICEEKLEILESSEIAGYEVEKGWDWQKAITQTKLALPKFQMDEPESEVKKFPEDLTLMNNEQLGKMMSQLEAWRSYVTSNIIDSEVDLGIMQHAFEIGLGKTLCRLEGMSEKKRLRESLVGYAISNNKTLKRVKGMLIELEARCKALNKIAELYTNQLSTVSREISRRTIELKYSGMS